ncbi:hypothetical protein CcI156_03665 [Frankia sp. CcI156]|uniref:hypothetical protein n=1 Tax=Frankia TaxID=1854 RepID=UPI0003D065B6|nr:MULTISPECIES: hypothetical protein [Frankia]ETA03121.1 hypothetical protein CcI6DRAFT_01440 [Frankia sp. CcI6]EYT92039.1 hypothetical protein ThrDRAFT_02283 [Frankia casuarinae]KDA42950.1 hypothetical protein BMG523Draft_02175 [Frankia sp. BMG5.23]KFB06105.1 hypothetical protein ALLO2DRAFT_01015 [Frankia sp. Allo2]OAA24124.1 hypothetical protein AAY23_104853 [Frankia casuarinae]
MSAETLDTPAATFVPTPTPTPTSVPLPADATEAVFWDGVLLVAATPGFHELKRTWDQDPILT